MRIRLDALLFGSSLVLVCSAIQPAMASHEFPGHADRCAIDQRAEDDEFVPMTRSERLKRYVTGTFGPNSLNKSAASAEIMQVRKVPKEWSRTPAGFGNRVGSAFAQHIVRGTLQYGTSSALHEDNRYRPSCKKGFWKRAGYAVSSTFLARRDNGRRRFSFSRIGSAGGASFISRTWLPPSIATAGAGASSFGLTIAFDVGANVFHEFWPDLRKKFLHR